MRMDVTGYVTFIGVDLHKCTVTLRAVGADGESLGQLKCDTKCGERIAEWIKALPGPKWLAVEACPFVEWFIDRFTPCVDRMDIADATELSLRRGKRRKNDPNDALDIALRLARGECPLGYPKLRSSEQFSGFLGRPSLVSPDAATLGLANGRVVKTLLLSFHFHMSDLRSIRVTECFDVPAAV